MFNDKVEEVLPPNNDPYFLGVRFNESNKSYFFSCTDNTIKVSEKIIVETTRGIEVGIVSIPPREVEKNKLSIPLKSIVRIATDEDIKQYEENKELAKEGFAICFEEIKKLNLDMNLTSCEYTLDRSKIIFSYLANERVDFRELLVVLASKFKRRIELRQIGTRDKAKLVGGIGVCGLPLCCSTFLNEFDGISINRAKNQMLSLNIPKLSGHCGKLICCLKFEDEAYTAMKEDLPRIGQRIIYNNIQYRISAINVITKVIKLDSPDDVKFVSLDEIKNCLPPKDRKENE